MNLTFTPIFLHENARLKSNQQNCNYPHANRKTAS